MLPTNCLTSPANLMRTKFLASSFIAISHNSKRLLGTVIVTGSNSGIGKAIATELVRRGASSVILACRNAVAGEQAVIEIEEKIAGVKERRAVICRHLDLTSFDSVRQFADGINKSSIQVDVLINNAGILPPRRCQTTVDGFEITFQTNFLGHFLLTNLLLDNLRRAPNGARVINTVADPRAFWLCWPPYSSPYLIDFYEKQKNPSPRDYRQLQAYVRSKLAITLGTTKALHMQMAAKKANVSTFAVDPGVIDPSKGRNTSPTFKAALSLMPKFLFKSFEQGAETAVYCATQPGLEKYSGKFFQNCKPIKPGARADDENMAQRLWMLSQDLIRPYLPKKQ